jgi:Mrp family chromosome partitioning ATPase
MAGHETGIMDVDIHGPNIPKLLGIGEKRVVAEGNYLLPVYVPPRLKVMSMGFLIQNDDTPVIWRGPVKMGVIRQFLEDVRWGDLDFLIVDLPPGTGD